MKRIYFGMLAVLAVCIMSVIGCRKNADTVKENGAVVVNIDGLARDESFINLNNAINRFDPKYLVLVYKDKRSTDEINARSKELLLQLSSNPENPFFQQQLADFYHFSSVDELKKYSAQISGSLKTLGVKYDFNNTLLTDEGCNSFFKARRQYIKTKLDAYPAGTQRTTSKWLEFVETYLSEMIYYTYAYDEEVDATEAGGGEFIEICDLNQSICKVNARKAFISNLVTYAGSGMIAVGGIAAAGGSAIPGVGTIAGAIGGGVFGGISGTMIAISLYSADMELCRLNYLKCLEEKKNNH